jgi:hypothetical protein
MAGDERGRLARLEQGVDLRQLTEYVAQEGCASVQGMVASGLSA